jgi:hypothetical protein
MGIEMLLFDKRVLKIVSVEFTIKPPYIVINLFKVYEKKINAWTFPYHLCYYLSTHISRLLGLWLIWGYRMIPGFLWRRSCINLYINIYMIYLSLNFIYKSITTLDNYHCVQRSIRGDSYVKRGVSVPKRLICEHGKFICICSNKGTESDQNY